ncbi:MAG: chitobiase/beta-hexosaminidase C-terminal domain-containing protein, partial [Deltaproteobacteria bacterium]|nr:chitobiase/beta-hexosaminidase C-terminal domain-containing protein [Deltaproteobacteria bacterium]
MTVSLGGVAPAAAVMSRASTIPSEVASLRLTVSSTTTPADMTPIVNNLTVTSGVTTYQLSVTVPNGSRCFLLEAFDDTTTLRYRGDATIILTGGTASLTIQMYSDVTPPSVLSVSPVSGATGVAVSSPVTVTFSEAMEAATVTAATFTVSAGGTSVPGTVGYSGTTATFTPTGNLDTSTSYTAMVTTGAEDLAGNAIASDYTWSFTTGAAGAVSAPTFSPVAGTYASAQSVTLSTSTPGATIRYTTDGSTPTSTVGTVYSGPVAVSATTTIRAIAYLTGWANSAVASAAYTITGTVSAPTFSPVAGTYASAQSVTLSSSTPGATIRYTTDGSAPTSPVGTVYSGPVAVSATTTIRAIAYLTGWTNSAVASAAYTITGTVSAPTFSPVAGTYASAQSVTLSSSTPGATIRYTTDGSTPTSTVGTVYSGPVAVSATTTIRAIAYLTGWTDSAVSSAAYTITGTVATPTFSPVAGTYTTAQSVTLSTSTPGATIRYTTDGSTPTSTTGTVYSGPIGVSTTTTIRAIAYLTGWTNSAVASAAYTITGTVSGAGRIAAGAYHTVAVKSDGTVWAWGYNYSGQLGDGTTTDRSLPVRVTGLSGVAAVAAGVGHTVAVKSDGTLWTCGANGFGQLGDGTTTNRSQPVQVTALSGVVAIAAGYYHTVAVKSDGTVWAWGYNGFGQLGDGTTTNRSQPVQVTALSGVASVAAGWYHTVAVKSDGTVWAWGYNGYGQLGDGTTTNRSQPVQVTALSGVVAIAAGVDHTVAVKSDGTVWAWGYN